MLKWQLEWTLRRLAAARRRSLDLHTRNPLRLSKDERPMLRLVSLVAATHGVHSNSIFLKTSPDRRHRLARHTAIYLSHVVLGRSYREIGTYFGLDRTTVSHACVVIEDLRDESFFENSINELELEVSHYVEPTAAIRSQETSRRNDRRLSTITRPPGSVLDALLRVLLTRRSYERMFSQMIEDAREEYFEALAAGNAPLARWRHIQMIHSVCSGLMFYWFASSGRRLVEIWRALGGP